MIECMECGHFDEAWHFMEGMPNPIDGKVWDSERGRWVTPRKVCPNCEGSNLQQQPDSE